MLSTEENKQKLEMLIRTFFNRLHGYHVQYNIVSKETLIDAQKHPENIKTSLYVLPDTAPSSMYFPKRHRTILLEEQNRLYNFY